MAHRSINVSIVRPESGKIERPLERVLIRAIILAAFAVAMGHLEAVVVYYIRLNLGDLQATANITNEHFRSFPWGIEGTRETATLVMLGAVALLTGRNWRERLAVLLWAFAIWDATYYGSLRIMTGWPSSFLSPDTYFLLPIPWGGPVWIPLAADALMVAAAGLLLACRPRASPLSARRVVR